MTEQELDQLIAAWLDGCISQSESELLQQQLRDSADARTRFHEYTRLDAAIRDLASGDLQAENAFPVSPAEQQKTLSTNGWSSHTRMLIQLACAASILIAVGGIAYRLGKNDIAGNTSKPQGIDQDAGNVTESTLSGYATLRRVAGVKWSDNAKRYRAGDVLPAGILEFDEGVAEIDFFCGATLIVEGPAKMDLESDWSVRFLAGRLRANVPPAARGFIVKAADAEIIDLGTEFALEVAPDNVRVEVVDGEVKLRGGTHDGDHLITGEGKSLLGSHTRQDMFSGLSTVGDVQRRHVEGQRGRFESWRSYSRKLRMDDRLIAYYPIVESKADRVIANAASTGAELDGSLVGLVNRTSGRFGAESAGLEFDRPGARVRTRIDGEYQAFTFACWVKIDSLEHAYNALFMSDGYENGELHWQIRDDGRLMFSVMIDDSQEIRVPNRFDQQVVKDAGLHRVYFTDPFWDISKSGQWFHLAAVYDPIGRKVTQFVDGEQISSQKIIDRFHITSLRIGPAEIGNWGQPFRKSAWFAVRNLNGTIDELAIFNAALDPTEIQNLYQQGKPLGY